MTSITLTNGQLEALSSDGSIEIDGGDGVVIDAAGASRVFYFGAVEAKLSNLTIRGGWANDYGAGIYNAGDLTLETCTITENAIDTAYEAMGAGIYNTGVVSILGCTISNNSITGAYLAYGAGVFAAQNTTTNIESSTVSGNIAIAGDGSSGAAVFSLGDNLSVSNSIITANIIYAYGVDPSAPSATAGGGICYCGWSMVLTNTTVTGNWSISEIPFTAGVNVSEQDAIDCDIFGNYTAVHYDDSIDTIAELLALLPTLTGTESNFLW